MKRIYSIIIILSLILPYFYPLSSVLADNVVYVVSHIKSDGTCDDIGTYNNFDSAKNAMNSYNSTLEDVAVIKRNNKIVYAKYGIFRPNTSNVITTFNTDYGSRYISPAYDTDTLFLDYDPESNKVKMMLSGASGWISLDQGDIYPISYITSGTGASYDTNKNYVKILYQYGIRLREGPGTNYKQVGCNGSNTCSSSQGGIWADGGSIYEWLNKNNVTNDGTNDWYQVNIGGNVGYIANEVAAGDLEIFNPSIGNKQNYTTYYYVSGAGELYHTYYVAGVGGNWSVRLGKAPLYLKQNVTYYSFDGNYFYDDYTKMVNDLRSGVYTNAVNKLPYYNYYQYLPTRTQTHYNAANLNDYIGFSSKIDRSAFYHLVCDGSCKWRSYGEWDSFPTGQSMLYGEGETFISSQEKYGVNAATTLALAIVESGWGRSYMSVREYNIFGHGAFDTAPDEYAASYESIAAGIYAHAYKFIALDYANPIDGYNYNGSHYGNKLSGNNVRYASDAYWGEKMASNYYSIDKNFGFQDFSQRATFGIKQIAASVPVYSDATTKSKKYYDLKNIPNIPVTILDEVKGENINGNNIWYKIQSDVPIDENRNLVNLTDGVYNFDTSYAYVHSSYIYKELKGPVISASDITISSGSKVDLLNNVTAYDAFDGDVTSKVKVKTSNLDANKVGTYNVVYTATDSENNTSEKTITVTVLESAPAIFANNRETIVGDEINLLAGVRASDYEDGDLTGKVTIKENKVDFNTIGLYDVTYSVIDSSNKETTKTIKVNVVAPTYKESDNIYYFDSLTVKDNNLHLKGFLTITNANNTLDNDIRYKLIFTNELDGSEIYQSLNRITSKDDIPFEAEGNNNLDYTYSWFEGDIDLTKLPMGNYTLSLEAHDKTFITSVPLSNVFRANIVETFEKDGKAVYIRNNFESRNAAIQMFVRDSLIGTKTSKINTNMNNEYSSISFNNQNLVIRGASYVVGGNYASDVDVKRTLTLENTNTYKRYTYDIGSITNGDYTIELRVPDGFDKTRSWFETNIDVKDLPEGTYTINLATSSNIADFGELQDLFNRKIDTSTELNGKRYTFNVNRDKRFRIELIVTKI